MMKKIAMLVMVVMMIMVSMMGTMTVSAATETAVEFKEDIIERFRWESYSPCQIEMMNWLYEDGFDDGVLEHISVIPVTVTSGGRTIKYSCVWYFVNAETNEAKRIDFYVTTTGEFLYCNWNEAYGTNKKVDVVPKEKSKQVIWFADYE